MTKRLTAALVFLAASTSCSDPHETLSEPHEDDVSASSAATLPSLDSPVLGSSNRLLTPARVQGTPEPEPMYAMNGDAPPEDVLVWKHDWEFNHVDEDEDTTLFGATVNAIGDIDGDGYDDFAVGGWESDVDVFIFHGRRDGQVDSPDMRIPTPQLGSHFGYSIATAGDVDNDGYDDVIIGAPSYSPSRDDHGGGGGDQDAGGDDDAGEDTPAEGAAYLYMGSANGLVSTPAAAWVGESPTDQFGFSVAPGGDLNRDGYDDVVIGSPFAPAPSGAPQSGRVHVYYGTESGLGDDTQPVQIEAPETGIAFGHSVAGVGDTEGDNFDDLLVGAIGVSDGEQFEGGAFLFSGSQDGVGDSPSWEAAGADAAQAYFGWRVDSAGDIDNDGFNDVVIGAPYYTSDPDDETQAYEGAVFVYMGSEGGLEEDYDWKTESDRLEGLLGTDISGGHDVNNDGFDDVLIADAHFGLVSFGGELYLGGEDGLREDFDWQAIYEGNTTIGDTARFIGDINGDNEADMLLGAPALASIYLYYGAPCFDADWDQYRGFNAITCPDGDDCEDLDDQAYPGADHRCDGLDTNCDGIIDEGCDDDEDGYCDADIPAWVPSGPPPTCPNGVGDCDDEDPDHNPGSPELCNFADDNCNDKIDEEPQVCGDDAICVQGGCFAECSEDAECDGDQRCLDGRCAEDPCADIECPDSREECIMGTCQVTCSIDAGCRWDDKVCIDGRCANDPCDGILCGSNELCDDGECIARDDGSEADAGNGSPDAGSPDAGNSDNGGGDNGGGDEGCSTTPDGVPPSGAMVVLVTLGGLIWRRLS